MTTLHPQLQALAQRQQAAGLPAMSTLEPAAARARFALSRAAFGKGPDLASVTDRRIERDGHSVPVRLYAPDAPVGICVYFHGGGWVLGDLEDFDSLMRELAARSNCVIVATDYRLAPEHPFPAALDDAATATRWAAEQGGRLFGLPPRVAVGGDSAGGNLAAATALALAPHLSIPLQLLFYPVVDCEFERESYRRFGAGLLLTAADMRWFFSQYAQPGQWKDPRIAVLQAPGLSSAPPTWIAIAAHDVLADECRAFAHRLAAAGVAVTSRDYGDLMHGFARMYGLVDSANHALDEAATALKAAFDRT